LKTSLLKKNLLKKLTALAFFLGVLLAAVACEQHHRKGAEITTPYAAVLLDNNQVYFGKLTNADSQFPELTDVYYIQNQVNQETKEVKNVLIRRGNEVHGPDRMFLNERHIIMIEPVGPSSKVAQLIADDKKAHP
jgi:hypothetical protein